MEWFHSIYRVDIPHAEILDIGCGTGFYVEYWSSLGARRLTGIDITRKSVTELAKRHPGFRFLQGDIGSNEIPRDRRYDLVTAFDVLFHIVDEANFKTAIRNIGEMAAPGALVLISDNFLKKPRQGHFEQAHRTLGEYTQELDANGLSVIGLKPIFVLMNGPVNFTSDRAYRVYRKMWDTIMFIVGKSELLGAIAGFLLYHIDGILVRSMKRSITTELLICRKRP
jgi:2-polyprenyl-3-methyl-5-hydroxy-6-metoxy-1,4-benzoquinol methylase